MIRSLVTVRHSRPGGRPLRVHVPVAPVLLVLSPLLLLAVLAGLVACLAVKVSPARAFLGVGRLLWASQGTRIEITQGRTAVLLSVG